MVDDGCYVPVNFEQANKSPFFFTIDFMQMESAKKK